MVSVVLIFDNNNIIKSYSMAQFLLRESLYGCKVNTLEMIERLKFRGYNL